MIGCHYIKNADFFTANGKRFFVLKKLNNINCYLFISLIMSIFAIYYIICWLNV